MGLGDLEMECIRRGFRSEETSCAKFLLAIVLPRNTKDAVMMVSLIDKMLCD